VKGIEICKLTRTQVLDMLENKIVTSLVGSSISLNYEDKQWNLKFSDVDYSYNYYEAVNVAYMAKEKAGFIDKMRNFFNIGNSGLNIDITHSYDKAYIDNLIEKIAKEIDRESVVATITLKSGNFIIMDDIPGRSLDKKKTYELIIDQLDKAVADSIQLPVVITEPTVKKSDLLNIKDKIGEFSTEFNTSDSDRASNLSLATRNTSNVLLLPDDVFSFNKIVGPRLEKYGFKMAKIIVNNQYTSGIGGGICQVSSTLYNAVLYSNLEVVERKNHSLPSTYVDMGRDATISGDYIDLKFKNNTGYPIYIYGEMKGNKVKFTIYGKVYRTKDQNRIENGTYN
jgi:vancomycin resistance protein YoaR